MQESAGSNIIMRASPLRRRGGLLLLCLLFLSGIGIFCRLGLSDDEIEIVNEIRSTNEQDLSCCKQFLTEAMAFDYCGSSFTEDDIKIAAKKFTKEYLIGIHLVEHKYLNRLTNYLHLLESFERNVLRSAVSDVREDAKRIKESLLGQREAVLSSQLRFDVFRYTQNVAQLLLSMVRIRESGYCREDIVKIIPEDLLGDALFDLDVSKCDWIHIGDDWFSRLRLFRDFVLISFYIEKTDSAGSVECSIGKIADSRLLSVMKKRGFQFISNKNEWTLFWSRVGVAKGFLESACLIPQVTGVTCITSNRTNLAGIVHLSSDFAHRRKEIFRHGECWRDTLLFVGREHIRAEKLHGTARREERDYSHSNSHPSVSSWVGDLATIEQRRQFGDLPNWKIVNEGQRCILLTTHYMINDKTNERDIDKSTVVALYHNENEERHRLRFVIRKRDSSKRRWEEVATGSCIIAIEGDKVVIDADSKEQLSGKVNVEICNVESAKRYFVIRISYEEWYDEVRVDMTTNIGFHGV